jgi:hypothetical protein
MIPHLQPLGRCVAPLIGIGDSDKLPFVQEDSPDEIGRAVAGWMKTLG